MWLRLWELVKRPGISGVVLTDEELRRVADEVLRQMEWAAHAGKVLGAEVVSGVRSEFPNPIPLTLAPEDWKP